MKDKSKNIFEVWFSSIKGMAKRIKRDLGALYLANKRSDVPIYAKIISILVVGYALSPIDLIPDFIPVLGYADDLILVPLGIYLVIKLIPRDVLEECRQQAENIFSKGKPKNWIAGTIIIFIWLFVIIYLLLKFTTHNFQ